MTPCTSFGGTKKSVRPFYVVGWLSRKRTGRPSGRLWVYSNYKWVPPGSSDTKRKRFLGDETSGEDGLSCVV